LTYAERFYEESGFAHITVPWLVDREISALTKPSDRHDFFVKDQALVGSAEQGFLQMIERGELNPGRYIATTPCFRDEDPIDFWHQQYFMKTELIDTVNVSTEGLERVLVDAERFFRLFLPLKRVQLGADTFDLVSAESGIELGSYGLRTAEIRGKHLAWVYGTGCAEPRLSKTLAQLKRPLVIPDTL
jgi:seryl-tRNA synthetase